MFRLCFIIASFLCFLSFGQTLKKSISDVTGRINPFTIAYDGSYYYMSAAGKSEKIYKVDVSTGNLVAESPTPLADFRTLVYLWKTSQLIGKTADSGNNASGHGVYVIDRNTLTLGDRISNFVIGTPDSALSYSSFSSSWGWWNTSNTKNPPLFNYKLQTNAKTVSNPYPTNTPLQGVTLDTRLHMVFSNNPSWIYYASQTFYIGSGNTNTPLQSNDFPNVNGSNFLGYTEDGLAWLYDESDGIWNGFFINEEPSCTDPFTNFPSNDQTSSCSSIFPSIYPQTCYGTYAYFNYSDGSSSFSCIVNKRDLIFTRYWIIWDLWNNTEYFNQTVTVPLPSPLSSLAPSNPVVQSCGSTNQPFGGASLETISTMYACTGPVSYVEFVIQHGCPNNYTLVRQWTHVDCNGITIYNQTAEYRDIQAPTISTAPNVTVNYGQSVSPPDATDNCTTNFTISYIDTLLSDGGCSNDSIVYRIWTISDSCNNATMPQFITIRPPLVNIPIDVTVECNNSVAPHPNVTGWAMSSIGNYTATWSDSIVYVNNDCNPQTPLYLYVARTWTVVDKCGRKTGVQHISLADKLAPNLQIPDDVEESCTSITAPSSTGYASATDMCIGNLNVTYSDTTTFGSCNQDLNIIRTWTATDKCGHTVSLEQSISQSDTIAPYFVLPPIDRVIGVAKGVKATCDASKLIAMLPVFQANVTIGDNCDPAPTHKITTDWSCGSLVLTWTLTDACGNTNTSLQNITESVQSPPTNEGITLVYHSFMVLALLVGWRMFF